MKDYFARVRSKVALVMALTSLLVGVNLAQAGKIELFGAFILGTVTGLIYVFLQGQRIKTSESKSPRAAKLNMFIGLILRLVFVFIVLSVAAKINTEVFVLVTFGFLSFYGVFYLIGIIENLKK